jgi:hypothetical protein
MEQKNQPDSDDFPIRAVVWVIVALTSMIVLFNLDFIARQIADQKLGFSQLDLIQAEIDIRRGQELHLAEVQAIRAEGDAWDRLTKLQRSARTEEQRAFVRSEVAKLQALGAERERVMKAAKAELKRMQ